MASLARTSLASSSRLACPQRLPPLIRASAQQLRHHSAPADPTSLASYAYTNPSPSELPPHLADTSGTSNLPPHHQETIASLLRVDHSGEIAANTIYSAQSSTFRDVRKDLPSAELTLDMWENEKKHLKVAEMLLQQYRVRPSLLNPVWGMLGSVLGGGTALMGREAAMACTEAVETVIGEHYDDQIAHLNEVLSSLPVTHSSVKPLETLRSLLTEFRDDELEHLDTAVEHDAQQAPAHALLSVVIGWGCKGAIEVAKRI